MNEFNLFPTKPNLTDSSKKLYSGNLRKLNNKNVITNIKFLLDTDAIDKKLAEIKTDNTRRTYLISIVSAMKGRESKKEQAVYKYYYDMMMNLNKELKNNTNKTEKQTENWIDQTEILAIFNEKKSILDVIKNKKKLNEDEYNELLHLVVLSLYVLQPPRRIIDFLDMLIVKQLHTDNQHNYLQRFDNKFVFNNYKTAGTYNQITDEIPDDLMNILDIYFNYHPLKKQMIKVSSSVPFLVKFDGTALGVSTQITRILNKIFGKRISVSMMRNIYLTDKYSEIMKEMSEDVSKMATSINTATTNYIKKKAVPTPSLTYEYDANTNYSK
jgi:hypothetical protein